jgi:hypothetical protein
VDGVTEKSWKSKMIEEAQVRLAGIETDMKAVNEQLHALTESKNRLGAERSEIIDVLRKLGASVRVPVSVVVAATQATVPYPKQMKAKSEARPGAKPVRGVSEGSPIWRKLEVLDTLTREIAEHVVKVERPDLKASTVEVYASGYVKLLASKGLFVKDGLRRAEGGYVYKRVKRSTKDYIDAEDEKLKDYVVVNGTVVNASELR